MKDLTWGDVVFVGLVALLVVFSNHVAQYPPVVNGTPFIKGNVFDCSLQLRETLNTHCVYKALG